MQHYLVFCSRKRSFFVCFPHHLTTAVNQTFSYVSSSKLSQKQQQKKHKKILLLISLLLWISIAFVFLVRPTRNKGIKGNNTRKGKAEKIKKFVCLVSPSFFLLLFFFRSLLCPLRTKKIEESTRSFVVHTFFHHFVFLCKPFFIFFRAVPSLSPHKAFVFFPNFSQPGKKK